MAVTGALLYVPAEKAVKMLNSGVVPQARQFVLAQLAAQDAKVPQAVRATTAIPASSGHLANLPQAVRATSAVPAVPAHVANVPLPPAAPAAPVVELCAKRHTIQKLEMSRELRTMGMELARKDKALAYLKSAEFRNAPREIALAHVRLSLAQAGVQSSLQ